MGTERKGVRPNYMFLMHGNLKESSVILVNSENPKEEDLPKNLILSGANFEVANLVEYFRIISRI